MGKKMKLPLSLAPSRLCACPAVENQFDWLLAAGERPLYCATLERLCDEEKESLLYGQYHPIFTLTDQKILLFNGAGLWTLQLQKDIRECYILQSGWLRKPKDRCLVIALQNPILSGTRVISEFQLYFKAEDMQNMKELLSEQIRTF